VPVIQSADDASDERTPADQPVLRLRFDISYDGAAFAGWAFQPGQRTVAGIVAEALATVLRLDERAKLTVAGRTDAGVHASGQVAHLDVPVANYRMDPRQLLRRLAGILPPDVRVWQVRQAPDGFDARFSAVGRRYTYRVCDGPFGVEPLRRGHVLWYPHPLDVDAMNAASRPLLGEHDFASFCKRREGATTIRMLRKLTWTRIDRYDVVADVQADAFCHSMVRALVGALLVVGDGRRPVEFPGEVLAGMARHPGVTVAAAHGLTLEEIYYPADDQLASRAATARQIRTLSGS
jgi:tRNA pseudouridine38-40 synthase